MANELDVADVRRRAFAWVRKPDGSILARDSALNEEHLALDVLDLIAEVENCRDSVRQHIDVSTELAQENASLRAEVAKLRGELTGAGMGASNVITRLHYEREELTARVQRLEAVWEAAKEWRAGNSSMACIKRLITAIDAAQEQDK